MEIFRADRPGTIIPNHQLGSLRNGGSTQAGSTRPQVVVHNYAGVDIETRITRDEVAIIARREALDTVHGETPKIMAQQMGDPSSSPNRRMRENHKVSRRM
jgi:hypothetical protein